MLVAAAIAMTASLCCQDQIELGEDPYTPYTERSILPFEDQAVYAFDPNPPEPDPLFTIRAGTPGRGTSAGNGRATYRLTGPATITVRIPMFGSRTAILGPGTEYTGPDRNRNNIPDELERGDIIIGPVE